MKLRIQAFLSRTTYLESELEKMSEKLKRDEWDFEKSCKDARSSEAIKNQYKLGITKLSACYKEYEKAIMDVLHNAKAMTRNQYWKYLESNVYKFKILSFSMCFYASGFNTRLKDSCDELANALSALS